MPFKLFRFPGAKPSDDIPNMLKLFLTRDLFSTVSVQAALFGGYADCDYDEIDQKFNAGQIKCDKNAVYDPVFHLCYNVTNVVTNTWEASGKCFDLNASNVIQFFGDYQVESFMDLLKSGAFVVKVKITMLSFYILSINRIKHENNFDIILGKLILPTHYNGSFLLQVNSVEDVKRNFRNLEVISGQYSTGYYAIAKFNQIKNKIQLRMITTNDQV
jgi:hypothetical protein